MIPTLLIVGDSFAADNHGWPSQLGFDVTNRSQRGVGAYKILKQAENHAEYDRVLIVHTSPWRVHTPYHPIHNGSEHRSHNDFMLADVEHHAHHNPDMAQVHEYLSQYYDADYQQWIWHSAVDQLMQIDSAVHCTFHDPEDTKRIPHNYNHLWQQHPGDVNHLDTEGNALVSQILDRIF